MLAISTTAGPLPDAIVGVPYTFTFQSNGGISPIAWTLASGQLPAGLTLNSDGTLTGTPTATGSFTFTVQAGDGSSPAQTITLSVAIGSKPLLVVNTGSGALPDAFVGKPYSTGLQTTGGTAPYNWTLTSGQLPAGLALSTAGVVSGTPTTASATPSAITVQVQDSGAPAQSKSLSLSIRVIAALVITTPAGALPDGVANTPYAVTLQSAGGLAPQTWSLTSGTLPAGLSLSSTGTISGTPLTANLTPVSFGVQVTDVSNPAQTSSELLTLRIAPRLVITTAGGALPDAVTGATYSPITLTFTGGIAPQVWSVSAGAIPPGMSLSTGGVISGSPSATGTFGFTARVQDSSNPAQSAIVSLSIRVAAPLTITTPAGALPDAVAGATYSPITLTFTGGIAPQVWSISAGAIPPGMFLSTGGVISGTPSATGTFGFAARVQDSSNPAQSATVSLSIRVAAPLTITTPAGALPDALYKTSYSQTLTSSGGNAPIVWTLGSGQLPPGLTMSSVGVISGSPAAT
ncbi:MAG TPA: putative Ig domain-containing protein, partial [Ktedonobacterales bacterium]|nr:putative Ig domain-containing protein [Ktedonobacterales bacterium]